MKKILNMLPMLAVTMSLSTLCSCGNSGKPQVDEQALKDSIENVFKDSLRNAEVEKAKLDSIDAYNKLHSKTVVEQELKSFLSEYVNTINDNIRQYLSTDFNSSIKKWEKNGGEWHLFGLNSSAMVERYTILNIGNVGDTTVTARVKLSIENEGEYEEESFSVHLLLENGKWRVDEINTVKKDLKDNMK